MNNRKDVHAALEVYEEWEEEHDIAIENTAVFDLAERLAALLESTRAEADASRIGDEWANVQAEMEAQVEKWGVQRHSDGTWHLILSEEVGEVARAILQRKRGDIEREIVQCAAVCLSWLKDRAHYVEGER